VRTNSCSSASTPKWHVPVSGKLAKPEIRPLSNIPFATTWFIVGMNLYWARTPTPPCQSLHLWWHLLLSCASLEASASAASSFAACQRSRSEGKDGNARNPHRYHSLTTSRTTRRACTYRCHGAPTHDWANRMVVADQVADELHLLAQQSLLSCVPTSAHRARSRTHQLAARNRQPYATFHQGATTGHCKKVLQKARRQPSLALCSWAW